MAIVEDRIVLAIGLDDLVQRLGDEDGAHAVAGHERERGLEEVEPPQRRELVEHQQEPGSPCATLFLLQALGEPPADLVQHEPDQRLGARDVGWRNDEVKGDRPRCGDKIRYPPVASRRHSRDGGIPVQPEERHCRGQHTRALVLRLVQHLARRRGDDRMHQGRLRGPEMVGAHHRAQGGDERALGVGEEGRDPRQSLVFLGVEDVEDCADQQRVTGLLPVAAALERPFGVHEDVGDVLDIAHLVLPAAHLQQRVVAGRALVGRVEQQAVREARSPAGGQLPILPLNVVDDCRAGPGEERRHDQADALAAPGGRERHDMLGAVVPKIGAAQGAQQDAGVPEQPRVPDLPLGSPAGGAVGSDPRGLARAPERSGDRGAAPQEPARCGQGSRLVEHRGRIGLIMVPPAEEGPRPVNGHVPGHEPRQSELGLVAQHRRGPLGRRPHAEQNDGEDDQELTDQKPGRRHGKLSSRRGADAGEPMDHRPRPGGFHLRRTGRFPGESSAEGSAGDDRRPDPAWPTKPSAKLLV